MAFLAICAGTSGCMIGGGADLPDDAIAADSYWLPKDSKPGMFITWSLADHGEVVGEQTTACVAETAEHVDLEYRVSKSGEPGVVTTVRFDRAGAPVAAWRGPPGGVGKPMRIVDDERSAEEAAKEAERLRQSHGLPAASTSEEKTIEDVETPAGRIACRRHRIDASMLFMSAHFTFWHAVDPLPLSSLVRYEDVSWGYDKSETLAAFGWQGAQPALTLPPAQPMSIAAPSRSPSSPREDGTENGR